MRNSLALLKGWPLGGGRAGAPPTPAAFDINRYMFAGPDLKPYNKQNQVPAGFENALSRWTVTAPVYGARLPRVGWINWNLSELGTAPVEISVPSPRVISKAAYLYNGAYYFHTFELMRGISGLTVSPDGFTITMDAGAPGCWADPTPVTMAGFEMAFIETLEVAAIGDYRGGGRVILGTRGEGVEYSASSLASKFANGSILANNVGGGAGNFCPGPAAMVALGWDGRPVGLLRGTSIWRQTGVTIESTGLRGQQTGIDRGLADAQIAYWNASVSGLTLGSLASTGFAKSKAFFDLLNNSGGAMPFTFLGYPGDVNGKTTSLPTWQGNYTAAWLAGRTNFGAIRMVQETSPPNTAYVDPTIEWTNQANQVPSSSPGPTVWTPGGIKSQLNAWTLLQGTGGANPDAILDDQLIFSEDANAVLTRNTLPGANTPRMADGTLGVAASATATSIVVITTVPPGVGTGLVVGVGLANIDEILVKRVAKRPDVGANAWEVFLAGGSPTTTGALAFAHGLGVTVAQQETSDGLHLGATFHKFWGQFVTDQAALGKFGSTPAVIPKYQSTTQSYFDRLPAAPSTLLLRQLFDDIFVAGFQSGALAAMDFLYVWAQAESSALINLKSANFTLTKVGNVTFNSNGATSDGTTGWLDTGCNPAVSPGLAFSRDSAHLGVIPTSNIAEDRSDAGNAFLALDSKRASNSGAARINTGAIAGVAVAAINPTSNGHFIAVRADSAGVTGYKNTITGTTTVQTSVAPGSANILGLNGATGISTKSIAVMHGGGALSTIMREAMYVPFFNLLRGLGAL